MKAVFQPTNYTFEFDDRYFVQVMGMDGTETTAAAFSDLSNAVSFAKAQVARPSVKTAYVYSRTHQHFTARKSDALPA